MFTENNAKNLNYEYERIGFRYRVETLFTIPWHASFIKYIKYLWDLKKGPELYV